MNEKMKKIRTQEKNRENTKLVFTHVGDAGRIGQWFIKLLQS